MKIYIETDLEGISGIVLREQAWQLEHREYLEHSRYYLMKEVNEVIETIYQEGATEVIVNDCHARGFNMIIEEMDSRPEYIQGIPRDNLLYGLDESFDAMILVGFHAMSGTKNAVLDHTFNSDQWIRYWINGIEMGEIGQLCVMAGYYKVPVIFVSGDRAAVTEAKKLLHDVETVAVKKAFSRTCAQLIHPKKARELIQAGVKKALKNITHYKPLEIKFPAEVKLEVVNTELADKMEFEGGAERVNGRTVKKIAKTAKDIVKF